MTKEAHDFLMNSSAPAVKFPEIGSGAKGTVLSYEKRQQTDMDGNAKTWDNGEPMWQVVFTLQTDERDPELDDDDGRRNLYAKAQMLNAIREAIRKTGHKGDLEGGKLGVKYVKDGESKKRGYQPPKLYAAKYEPPAAEAALGETEPAEEFSEEPF